MSAPPSYRAPAWSGLDAATPVYESVNAQFSSDILQALGSSGVLRRMANMGDASSVFLRLDAVDTGALFLKVVSPERGQALSQTEELARWLQGAALPVVASERSNVLADGRQLWVYPFHAGRPPQAHVADMAMIGSALGKLHGVLQGHHLRSHWKQNTDARMLGLMQTREAVAQGRLRAGPDAQGFQQIASDRSIALHPDMFADVGPRIPIHGDLNRFNMLMDDKGCTFLDFEDVQHSVFPAMVDLVTVIERVVLVSREADTHTPCIEALLRAYRTERPDVDLHKGMQALPAIQRSIALRSLCTLAETDPSGLHVDEWSKFFTLQSLAEGEIARNASEKGMDVS